MRVNEDGGGGLQPQQKQSNLHLPTAPGTDRTGKSTFGLLWCQMIHTTSARMSIQSEEMIFIFLFYIF